MHLRVNKLSSLCLLRFSIEGKRLPTELYRQEEELKKEMDLEDVNTASKSFPPNPFSLLLKRLFLKFLSSKESY